MDTQGRVGRTVTAADVLAVLELARCDRATAAPAPVSWDAVIARIRAVLAAEVAPPGPAGATLHVLVSEDSTRGVVRKY